MVTNEQTLEQLLNAIRAVANNQDIGWAQPPQPLTGGFWAQLWRVRLTGDPGLDGDLVARVMPDSDTAAKETLVQAYLASNGFSTPNVRLSSEPTDELDRAWLLMDFAAGEPLIPNLSGASTLLRLPRLARTMPDTLARCAADLHRVAIKGLTQQLGTDDTIEELLNNMRARVASMDDPELIEFADSLVKSRPASVKSVISHGDLHPFNVLVGPQGYIALDWSVTQLADPCHDLAFTHMLISNPPLVVPRPIAGLLKAAGRMLGRRFLKSYERFSETTIDAERFEWFTRFSALRAFVDAAWWEHSGEVESNDAHPFVLLVPTLRKRFLGDKLT